ncbi:MAG: hypothetical protein AB1659_00845 [Thermodesulfobacteriota bacterium]
MKRMIRWIIIPVTALIYFSSPSRGDAVYLLVDHRAVGGFSLIPGEDFDRIRAHFNIYYGHTSHGSQLVTGMGILENEDDGSIPGRYDRPLLYEDDPDLGYPEWETKTRNHLNSYPQTNLVIWSWCGQLSSYTASEVNDYLNRMNQLEQDYPQVTFVYMTGHLDGTGSLGTLNLNNEAIRSYCRTGQKILFDFADIESHDPDGNFYPDGSDGCEWCSSWCESRPCPTCTEECAHSQCINCYNKGKAFWWMLHSLIPQPTGSAG